MKNFKMTKIMIGLSIVNLIGIILVVFKLPDRVPVHLNYLMEIDRWGSKWYIPFVAIILVFVSIVHRIYNHKNKENIQAAKNEKVQNILIPLIELFLIIISWLPVIIGFQYNLKMGEKVDLPFNLIIGVTFGLFMMISSNYFGVIKQNRWLGIRTIWTLRDETVWKRTHRLGAYTGVLGGFIITILSIISFLYHHTIIFVAGIVIGIIFIAIIPILYSYFIRNTDLR